MKKVKSVVKWMGLYLLANLGGAMIGWGLGAAKYTAVFSAGIFVLMIIYTVIARERNLRV